MDKLFCLPNEWLLMVVNNEAKRDIYDLLDGKIYLMVRFIYYDYIIFYKYNFDRIESYCNL